MFFKKTFIVSFLLLCAFMANVSVVNDTIIDPDFSFCAEELTDETIISFVQYLDISPMSEKAEIDVIHCFDVNEKGIIAIGHDTQKNSIEVIDQDGTFLYGYEFNCGGSFRIKWDNDNIILFILRGQYAITLSPEGKVLDAKTFDHHDWTEYIHSQIRNVNGTEYRIYNTGIFAYIGYDYSHLNSIDKDGTEKIIYNAEGVQSIKVMFVLFLSLCFSTAVIFIVIKAIKRTRKEYLSKLGK